MKNIKQVSDKVNKKYYYSDIEVLNRIKEFQDHLIIKNDISLDLKVIDVQLLYARSISYFPKKDVNKIIKGVFSIFDISKTKKYNATFKNNNINIKNRKIIFFRYDVFNNYLIEKKRAEYFLADFYFHLTVLHELIHFLNNHKAKNIDEYNNNETETDNKVIDILNNYLKINDNKNILWYKELKILVKEYLSIGKDKKKKTLKY